MFLWILFQSSSCFTIEPEVSQQGHTCSTCHLTFGSDTEWACHQKKFCCPFCDHVCTFKHNMSRHIASHNRVSTFKCDLCVDRRSFSRKETLDDHMNRHTGAMPHACPICQKRFASARNKRRHVQSCKQTGAVVLL